MHVTADPDLLVAVGDGHRVIIVPVAHQGERTDPCARFVTGLERRRRQTRQLLPIALEPSADSLAVAAQHVALPFAALLLQVDIEGLPTLEPGDRSHEVPPRVADQTFHLALVIAFAGTTIAVLEKVMGLEPAERLRPLPPAVRQYAGH